MQGSGSLASLCCPQSNQRWTTTPGARASWRGRSGLRRSNIGLRSRATARSALPPVVRLPRSLRRSAKLRRCPPGSSLLHQLLLRRRRRAAATSVLALLLRRPATTTSRSSSRSARTAAASAPTASPSRTFCTWPTARSSSSPLSWTRRPGRCTLPTTRRAPRSTSPAASRTGRWMGCRFLLGYVGQAVDERRKASCVVRCQPKLPTMGGVLFLSVWGLSASVARSVRRRTRVSAVLLCKSVGSR